MAAEITCDVAVVGSGFGGAVSALRLAEKGWDVAVLEQGRRLGDDDLLAARRDLRSYLWEPAVGLHGFFWQRVFRDMAIIGANGVGGGSIVWGAVLLEPEERFFADPAWPQPAPAGGWGEALRTHYATAARMLGRVPVPASALGEQDDHLRAAAVALGAGDSFGVVPSGIYFGDGPGRRAADPFFDGAGPEREGCRLCGGCLVGCPYGAKNSLDRNYLHLAERAGARIHERTRVDAIVPLAGGGYRLRCTDPLARGAARPDVVAHRVVLAGGVLGTLELLLRCRDELGTLPRLSPTLGTQVRTNSEAVTGILQPRGGPDLTRGPSISTDFHPDARTHVTQNRYAGGGRLLRLQVGPLVDGADPGARARRTLAAIGRHPLRHLRVVLARDFEQRFTALTVMQRGEGDLRLRWRRSPLRPWRRALRSSRGVGEGPGAPSYLPVANEVTRAFAAASGGTPLNLLPESVGGRSVTAHILGGAIIGASSRTGVVDVRHEAFGHPGLYVADASVIPADVGVNPSLTITAMAERFAAGWPERSAAEKNDDNGTATAEHPLPATVAGLTRLWAALPAPPVATLAGDRRARFVGPSWLRAIAPRGIALLGLRGWWGKRFDAAGTGTNLVRGGAATHLRMRATLAPSALDGRPVLLVTYVDGAPEPWRRVRDELRALPDGRLLGMSCVPAGPLTRGLPFVLDRPSG